MTSELRAAAERLTNGIAQLQSLQSEYHWSIGSSVTSDFSCSIWERGKWRYRGRVVINASGLDFPSAIESALHGLRERGPMLKRIALFGVEVQQKSEVQ